jgi:hypothetical protein
MYGQIISYPILYIRNKNYDSLETWMKEKTRPSPKNLKRWNIYTHEWKISKNERMKQSQAMEYGSRKAPLVLEQRLRLNEGSGSHVIGVK